MMMNNIKKMLKNKSGVVTIEYALGLVLIGLVFIVGMTDFTKQAVKMFYCNSPDGDNENSEMCQDNSPDMASYSKSLSMKNMQFNTGISVKAGEKYVITASNPAQKFSFYGDGMGHDNDFYDPFNEHPSINMFATVSSTSLDGTTVGWGSHPGLNFSYAENGSIEITADQDGFLQIGMRDSWYGDNRTSGTTDGTFGFEIQQVK